MGCRWYEKIAFFDQCFALYQHELACEFLLAFHIITVPFTMTLNDL